MHARVHLALRNDLPNGFAVWKMSFAQFYSIEGVMQWFVERVSNIAESLNIFIARCVHNCSAALRKGVAMILLHCQGVLQWFCFAALREDLAMP